MIHVAHTNINLPLILTGRCHCTLFLDIRYLLYIREKDMYSRGLNDRTGDTASDTVMSPM